MFSLHRWKISWLISQARISLVFSARLASSWRFSMSCFGLFSSVVAWAIRDENTQAGNRRQLTGSSRKTSDFHKARPKVPPGGIPERPVENIHPAGARNRKWARNDVVESAAWHPRRGRKLSDKLSIEMAGKLTSREVYSRLAQSRTLSSTWPEDFTSREDSRSRRGFRAQFFKMESVRSRE